MIGSESDWHMRKAVSQRYSPRINPFNNDDTGSSFNDDFDTVDSSSRSEITSTGSDGSGDVTLAELGLTEDYFSQPEGHVGLSSIEELEAAIDNCKSMVIDARENSERKKKLVNKLIELRMKFQDLKETPSEVEPKTKTVFGHKLRRKKTNRVKYYCDCCSGLIWGALQAWYRCKECGFNCHSKCSNMIRRKCIAIDLVKPKYILEISPETGLSRQQFNCYECKNPISVIGDGKEEARLCEYTGNYFCPQCHWNDCCVLPARVLHNWDFTPQKVSRQSLQILSKLYKKPLLNVQECNPLLFNYVDELCDLRKQREDILLMKEYFVTCNDAMEQKLLLRLSDRQHFVDNSLMYSLEDLVLIQDGSLPQLITNLVTEYAQHIKFDCLRCQYKGFFCEICNSGETLFAFDAGASMCLICKAVFHKDCFSFIDCPRCERMRKRKECKNSVTELSDDDDVKETGYLKNVSSDESESTKTPEVSSEDMSAFSTSRTPTNDSEYLSEKSPDVTFQSNDTHSPKLRKSYLRQSSYGRYSLPEVGRRPYYALTPEKNHPADLKSLDEMDGIKSKKVAIEHRKVVKHHFPNVDIYSDKYESNPITRQAQRNESHFSDLVAVKGKSRTKSHKSNEKPRQKKVQSHKINVDNPFENLYESKGSKFVREASHHAMSACDYQEKKINPFTKPEPVTDQPHNGNQILKQSVDPFAFKPKVKSFIKALQIEARPRSALSKYETYDPDSVAFNHGIPKQYPGSLDLFQPKKRFFEEAMEAIWNQDTSESNLNNASYQSVASSNPFESDSQSHDYDKANNPFS